MSTEEIRAKVVEQIRKATCEAVVTDDNSRLQEDCGLDYMDRVELVMDIEEELGVLIEDEDVDEMKTVGDLVKTAQEAVQRQAEQEAV